MANKNRRKKIRQRGWHKNKARHQHKPTAY
jgi:hypothetical protein